MFFQRLVLATLPLTAGCSTQVDGGNPDLASTGVIVLDGGFPDGGNCSDYCAAPERCIITPTAAGTTLIQCYTDHTGRRPATLRPAALAAGESELGRLFAQMAHLEAASVHAFQTLAGELRAYGATDRLVAAALRAADDEVRHTRLMSGLARQFGGQPVAPEVDPPASRSLEEIALENAVEGCVRESFGALVATWQAHAACDPTVRRAMMVIAADETRHAELAWSIAGWSGTRLDGTARARVAEARQAALSHLRLETTREPGAELVSRAGVPSTAHAQTLLAAFTLEVERRAAA